jgi:SSS family solute:Na+ symporter
LSPHLPSVVVAAYFVCMILVTVRSARRQTTSISFLKGTGSLPTWVVTVSFLAANFGALEIVGLSGIAARYGVQAFHFYLIGAIPALVFVSFVIADLSAKRSSQRPRVPWAPLRRQSQTTKCALPTAKYLPHSGISLYALSEILPVYGGWTFSTCAL